MSRFIASYGGLVTCIRHFQGSVKCIDQKLLSELSRTGILVNSVDHGWVATDMVGHGGSPVEEVQEALCRHPLCNVMAPAEDFLTMVNPNFGNKYNKQIKKEQNCDFFVKPMIFEDGKIRIVGSAVQYGYHSQ